MDLDSIKRVIESFDNVVTVPADDAHRSITVAISHPDETVILTHVRVFNLHDALDRALNDDHAEAEATDGE
jgi:hypothetical protein